MPKSQDETLALIRTLLAIADGGSPHEPERELARRRAEKLMLRHSLDEAAVRMTAQQAREPVRSDVAVVGSWVADRIALRGAVYAAFGCRAVRVRRGDVDELVTFGFAADMSLAAVLSESLEPQMLAEMYRHGGRVSDKRAFAAGFTMAVAGRLRQFYAEALTEAESEGTSSALVVAARGREVDAALARDFPDVRSSNAPAVGPGLDRGCGGRRPGGHRRLGAQGRRRVRADAARVGGVWVVGATVSGWRSPDCNPRGSS